MLLTPYVRPSGQPVAANPLRRVSAAFAGLPWALSCRLARVFSGLLPDDSQRRTGEEAGGVLHHLGDDTLACFLAAPGTVRGDDQAGNVHGQQRVAILRRFLQQDVGRRAAQVAAPQCVGQCLFIHQAAACGVDQEGAWFHQRQFGCADQVACLFVEGAVQGQCIDLRQQFVQRQAVGARRATG